MIFYVSTWAWIPIKVLLQLELPVKSELLASKSRPVWILGLLMLGAAEAGENLAFTRKLQTLDGAD